MIPSYVFDMTPEEAIYIHTYKSEQDYLNSLKEAEELFDLIFNKDTQ